MMLVKGVADSPHPPSVWELAQQSGLNRSTAWRILTTLEHHGMVERDPATARYHVGHAAMHLAAAADYDGVVRRVRPILTGVAEHVGESVTLAAWLETVTLLRAGAHHISGPWLRQTRYRTRRYRLPASRRRLCFVSAP